jgi:hypothetical protein
MAHTTLRKNKLQPGKYLCYKTNTLKVGPLYDRHNLKPVVVGEKQQNVK